MRIGDILKNLKPIHKSSNFKTKMFNILISVSTDGL